LRHMIANVKLRTNSLKTTKHSCHPASLNPTHDVPAHAEWPISPLSILVPYMRHLLTHKKLQVSPRSSHRNTPANTPHGPTSPHITPYYSFRASSSCTALIIPVSDAVSNSQNQSVIDARVGKGMRNGCDPRGVVINTPTRCSPQPSAENNPTPLGSPTPTR
jgi:hypothetical protein